MSSKVDLQASIESLDPAAQAVCRQLVARYEGELDQVTAHLSQIYEELMVLYDVGGEIGATLDPHDIADQTVQRVVDLLDAGGGVVCLAEDAASGRQPQVIGHADCAPCVADLVGWATSQAIGKDRSLIVNDLAEAAAPSANGTRSLVTSPLRARGRLIGALHVLDKAGDRGFSTEDQMLLETVASQVGVAIENSRLFQRAQQHALDLAAALDELESTYDDTLAALSGALDLRDNETEGHARRVTRYSVRIAEVMGSRGQILVDIERGALLHDIGKIGVPDAILLKPAKLTDEEWAVMRTHPHLGYQMIRNIRFLSGASPIVLHHHERYDGGGYPAGLTGQDIPLGARIFAIADTFDAMTSDRPYRKALPYEAARDEIGRCAGSQFDPVVVEAFCQVPEEEWADIREAVETELANRRHEPEQPVAAPAA